jgi:hypothetical protein
MIAIETILSRKLEEFDSTIDALGSDRKVLQLANQDFANYLKFTRDSSRTDRSMEEKAELESFLTVWTGMWLKKWKSRVKLMWGNEVQKTSNKTNETLSKAEPLWKELKCRREMAEIVASSLIKNGEICGTEILAEHLLKMELGEKSNQDINSKEKVMTVLNNTLRRAREMAQNTGPLIFVRVDKGYFTRQLVRRSSDYEVEPTLGHS